MLRPGRDVVLQVINLIRVTDRLPFNLFIARARRESITGKNKLSIIVKRLKLHELILHLNLSRIKRIICYHFLIFYFIFNINSI